MLHEYKHESDVVVLAHTRFAPSIFGRRSMLQSWARAGAQNMASAKAASASMAKSSVRLAWPSVRMRVEERLNVTMALYYHTHRLAALCSFDI